MTAAVPPREPTGPAATEQDESHLIDGKDAAEFAEDDDDEPGSFLDDAFDSDIQRDGESAADQHGSVE